MSKSWFFLFLLLSLFHTFFLSSPSSSPTSIPQLCLQDERSALLELKKKHYHVYTNYDPLNSWKPNTDCCYWEGITCNGTTGHVVGLDLSDSSLHGSIHSNSTLFYLHQLQMLNLSRNVFYDFAPSGFHRLSRLLHLNLSDNYFSGQIPSQISQLTGLVSLDLSWNLFVGQISSEISSLTKLIFLDLSYNGEITTQLEIPNLGAFVQNLSMLRELRIDWVDLSAQRNRDWCRHLSSALPNLHVLSMIDCSLTGPLDASISSLRFFSELYLDSNHYNLSSTIPSSLLNLTSLTVLSLYECGFYGDFPSNVFLLPNLKYINLSENPLLLVHLPEFPQVNSTLQYLDVSKTKLQGKLPSSVGNIKFLKELNLDGCNFSGPIPPFLANLTHLERLRLDDNFLQGPLLSYLFFLPSIVLLELANNQLSGVINEQQPIVHNISSFSSWVTIDLSGNHLKGQDLMRLISKIKGKIEFLDLSFNDFGYIDIVEDGNLSYVRSLSSNLSGENLVFNAQIQSLHMASCNIGKFPDFLIRNQKDLAGLDLSNNRISEFPDFLGDLKALSYLDISSNRIDGAIPITLFSKATNYFSIAANKLTGKIPFSICNASNLDVLDLSNNRLSGNIPTCLGNNNLGVLNLEGNKLHGSIPSTFKNGCNLQTLKLNKNKLQGKVPRSLGNCEELEVLDMSDNQLNDTFPHWLENLSKLQVLVIRSNKFGGPIADQLSQVDSPFPSLHVIDLSFNNFIGNLPVQYICHWKAMMFDEVTSTMQYHTKDNYSGHYQDTLAIMDKGLYLHMPRVLNTFITIDLSNNNFEGKIPDVLGNLKALKVLNLSGNSLTGQIPFSLGNLSELESLDLSRNKLSGEIPRQLTDLTFLEVLNLSYNNFEGSIPQGRQFDTFLNASYEGNAGLCGSPLSRKCGVSDQTLPPTSITFQQNEDDSTCLLDWTFALAGCCSGLIIGLVIGQQLFWRKNRCSEFISRVVVSKQRKWSRKIKCNKEGK